MPPSVWIGWWRSFMREATEASLGVVKAGEYDKSTLILISALGGAARLRSLRELRRGLRRAEARSAKAEATKQSRIARVVLDCFASLAMTS
jgi:hypothetical protein